MPQGIRAAAAQNCTCRLNAGDKPGRLRVIVNDNGRTIDIHTATGHTFLSAKPLGKGGAERRVALNGTYA